MKKRVLLGMSGGVDRYLLDKTIFPLGNFSSKDEIRQIAKKHNLLIANKPDSEDICFVREGNYRTFFENNSKLTFKEGNIVNKDGKILGKHTGLYKYTIGQRRGLGISSENPLYVIGFNKYKNELIIGDEKELYRKEFYVDDINFFLYDEITKPVYAEVKTRYSCNSHRAKIIQEENKIKVIYDEPQKNIVPGQSAVFYEDDVVIGGGKIVDE